MSRHAQLVERKTLNLMVVGSSPTVGVPPFYLIFAEKRFKTGPFHVRGGDQISWRQAPVAQLAARGSHNPKVASSILVGSSCLYSSVWQSMRLVSARSRVRSSLEAIIRVGVVGNISACHADARGSIPRHGGFFFLLLFGAKMGRTLCPGRVVSQCMPL